MDRRKNSTDFNGDELEKMGMEILEGLNFIHSKGENHGDIRP